jgi:LysM repeat protein
MTRKRVFISYRREDFDWALRVRSGLRWRGINAFVDVTGLHSGKFEKQLYNEIGRRTHFVVLLSRDALKPRPDGEVDWLRKEIDRAVDTGRTIVPVLGEDFDKDELKSVSVTAGDALSQSQTLRWVRDDLQFGRMNRLATMVRGRPLWPSVVASIIVLIFAYFILASLVHIVPFSSASSPTTLSSNTTAESTSPPTTQKEPSTSGPSSASTTPPSQLAVDQQLEPGDFLVSANGLHRLDMTTAGTLQASTNGVVWWNEAVGPAGSWTNMQSDGNLVVYQPRNLDPSQAHAVWQSHTNQAQHRGAHLELVDVQGHGEVHLVDPDGKVFFRRPEAPVPTVHTAAPNTSGTGTGTPTSADGTTSSTSTAPPTTAPSTPAPPKTYKVQPGDTWTLIAKKLEVTVQDLQACNKDTTSPRQGQSLVVPPC